MAPAPSARRRHPDIGAQGPWPTSYVSSPVPSPGSRRIHPHGGQGGSASSGSPTASGVASPPPVAIRRRNEPALARWPVCGPPHRFVRWPAPRYRSTGSARYRRCRATSAARRSVQPSVPASPGATSTGAPPGCRCRPSRYRSAAAASGIGCRTSYKNVPGGAPAPPWYAACCRFVPAAGRPECSRSRRPKGWPAGTARCWSVTCGGR